MNILFYCDEYPPAKHGGIGSVVKIVAETLASKGHKVYIVGSYSYSHNLPHYSVINNVHIYRNTFFNYLKYVPKWFSRIINKILKEVGILSRLAEKAIYKNESFIQKLIEQENIDIIEVSDYMEPLKFLKKPIPFKRYKVPSVIRVHGSLSFFQRYSGEKFNPNSINPVYLQNDINNFARCTIIAPVSKFAGQYVSDYLQVGNSPIQVIPNPLEKSLLAHNPMEAKEGKILFIGKINQLKGAFSALKAFSRIANKYPKYKLIMVGRGKWDNTKKLIPPELKDRVLFTGLINRSEVIQLIDEATFCMAPSFSETFGMVAVEIMARGKALIFTTRTSGPEIVDHMENGILVDPADIEQMSNYMELLITDRNLRKTLGENANNKVLGHFIADKVVSDLECLYRQSFEGIIGRAGLNKTK